ncbi:MAG: molybdenum ABC transporter ATP-binding protein [gamma proteobacterium symbiont of Bathyaustriella thionipta]|nr:molybdenum ABC transporter ATP-binding protein [gamma proteobacterium symbiont of Bathyaustriella thionipta]MCU7949561.1 molybdenum ABC transporter ATP-binding protein [gamma proteobacterium symbiont of Bathyaustriella thionipta]MCU7952951.1 molybdenum ABC transporter ATP-binding protein [gamma proteobacterium symbiont of Bathyaustriella thionipta]MCU7956153.1 molybdenum ABC transporter ATP-binding protein [gamma proteobacterium symbiont of Bathyaustriella thionipta]MCU7966679.1 molybdenum A
MSIEAKFYIDRGDFSLDIALTIPERGVTALFGPSGCGKTTLLRAIAGLEKNCVGYLKVGDEIWQNDNKNLPPHQRPVGYVFQEPSLFAHLNVRRNLEYGLKRLPEAMRKVSLQHAVELLGIGHLLARKPHQLSGGEQQRVAIARALAVSPAMLLMDEPLAALDMIRKREILPYLESLHRELDIPVLYVSHSREEVARLGDNLVLLEAGRVQAKGTVSELFSRLDLALAHGPETETVIKATVAGYDEEFELSYLDFSGGRFAVAGKRLPLGSAARLQVLARDISITLERQSQTSILNIFAATVDEMMNEGTAQITVRLMIGSVPVLARITRKSATDLGLQPGLAVYAQVKSVALLS